MGYQPYVKYKRLKASPFDGSGLSHTKVVAGQLVDAWESRKANGERLTPLQRRSAKYLRIALDYLVNSLEQTFVECERFDLSTLGQAFHTAFYGLAPEEAENDARAYRDQLTIEYSHELISEIEERIAALMSARAARRAKTVDL